MKQEMKQTNQIKGNRAQYFAGDCMKYFEGVATYRCGCKSWSNDHRDFVINHLCYDCLHALIGTRQVVVRYGNLPACGRSYNHRERKYEQGVSCYLVDDKPLPWFTDRHKHIFSAVIIAIGSDEEPIIDAESIIY